MANQTIPATQPTSINATYDSWAFRIESHGFALVPYGAPAGTPTPPIGFTAKGVKFRNRSDGLQEQSPLASDQVTLVIPDLYAAAAQKPYIATALANLMAAIQQYGTETGRL